MSTDILKLPAGVLAGTKFFGEFISFDEGKRVFRDKTLMTSTARLVVLATTEKLQRWKDGAIDDDILPKPGEMLPDVDVLNAEIPVEQWELGKDGRPKKPWEHARLVYLIDPTNVDRFTYSSATIGARIAVTDLEERIEWMSRFRGSTVHAVVSLASRPMKTRFGLRSRPHFQVVEWVFMGGPGSEPLTIEGPKAPLQTIDTTTTAPGLEEAEPLTIGEELNDDLPF